jgi:SpoVK/Ycf46/Vps4 family AAA+-type ATPase
MMPHRRKELIKALVKGNRKEYARFDDFIRGKGQGLIMMLHGPPGTGKTLTAEAIAEHLGLPLYTMTSKEMDQNGTWQIEQALDDVLQLAARWDAVLLLDEADTLLEARSHRHLERNRRVAVFLRALEYYRGVLILTTNLPVTFDKAFRSRIHLTLEYPALDEAGRVLVWKTFLESLAPSLGTAEYEELARYDLNGREIKNTVKMSAQLAEEKGADLSMSHLRTVIDIAEEGRAAFSEESTDQALSGSGLGKAFREPPGFRWVGKHIRGRRKPGREGDAQISACLPE